MYLAPWTWVDNYPHNMLDTISNASGNRFKWIICRVSSCQNHSFCAVGKANIPVALGRQQPLEIVFRQIMQALHHRGRTPDPFSVSIARVKLYTNFVSVDVIVVIIVVIINVLRLVSVETRTLALGGSTKYTFVRQCVPFLHK